MACVPAQQVTSGYYRNNLYVVLGLNVLATMIAWGSHGDATLSVAAPLTAACLSYLGAVAWLYESRRAGMIVLAALAIVTLIGAWFDLHEQLAAFDRFELTSYDLALRYLAVPTSGLVAGVTMAAMLLGHWYLNAPGMRIAPLQRLVVLMAAVVIVRAVLAALGIWAMLNEPSLPTAAGGLTAWGQQTWLLVLRWLAGIFGALGTAWMSWQTLKIPNTQSATGILYVGVMFVFLGELIAELLCSETAFAL